MVSNPDLWPFGREFGRETSLLRGGLVHHGYQPLSKWDDPPSRDPGSPNLRMVSWTLNTTRVSLR